MYDDAYLNGPILLLNILTSAPLSEEAADGLSGLVFPLA